MKTTVNAAAIKARKRKVFSIFHDLYSETQGVTITATANGNGKCSAALQCTEMQLLSVEPLTLCRRHIYHFSYDFHPKTSLKLFVHIMTVKQFDLCAAVLIRVGDISRFLPVLIWADNKIIH